ncbi:MAG: HNH endonuclease [Anaerolineae bacterium]|nr:HNH endonuclease [Anaerolineae bacterium]
MWVSEFAQNIIEQNVFRLTWPDLEPMWVASALCWASGREDEEDVEVGPSSTPPIVSTSELIAERYKDLSLAELRRRAVEKAPIRASREVRQAIYRTRSDSIRAYALKRAAGICEGCSSPAPFQTASGQPFLEIHHLNRRADGGLDVPENVIALCPNCHRRAHHADDGEQFNSELKRRIRQLESSPTAI